MKNDGTKTRETLLKGLEREANILKDVDHPVIPRIIDIVKHDGTICVVMDFIEGENLADKLKEECGVFGVYSHDLNVSELTYYGLFALQHRGQESTGIAVTDGAWMDVTRGMGLVREVFRHQVPQMENQYIAIGHVRYSTTGSSLLANTQPLMVNYSGGKIALAHNGNLTNAGEIRKELEESGTIFQTTIDSEVVVNLIARSRKVTVEEKIIDSLKISFVRMLSYSDYDDERSENVYTGTSSKLFADEVNVDTIFASDQLNAFGLGIIMDYDGSYCDKVDYTYSDGVEHSHPEQHLLNRIINRGRYTRRIGKVNVLSNLAAITPYTKCVLPGFTGYPIAINRYWVDDITEAYIAQL